MSQYFIIHSDNPQHRLIKQVTAALQQGAVIALPTDAAYVLSCKIDNKSGLERMKKIRQLDDQHLFSLMCQNLSHLGTYAQVNNESFRFIKALIPGPFTFVLEASREAPKRILHQKRKTIGLRVPDNLICQALLEELGEPLLTTTLKLPLAAWPLADPEEIKDILAHQIDIVIDGGICDFETTTIIDLTGSLPEIVRAGKGRL